MLEIGKLEIECGERGISKDLLSFLDKCFKWKREKRATAVELLQHPFITREKGF